MLVQLDVVAAVVSAILTAIALFAGVRSSGVLKRDTAERMIEGGVTPEQISELKRSTGDEKPFETIALSNYYNHALRRANVSFWFSLSFASLGFLVIVAAFITHTANDMYGTILKLLSGTIIDVVASLFFVQSTNAQKSMADFFEKLRLDRLNLEARKMIDEVENVERRDQLRSQLILKFSGINQLIEGSSRT